MAFFWEKHFLETLRLLNKNNIYVCYVIYLYEFKNAFTIIPIAAINMQEIFKDIYWITICMDMDKLIK